MIKMDFNKIEKKWQEKWEKTKCFNVKEGKKKKYYVLEMFPYPSSSGLHMGHALNYTIGDIFARFKRMSGFNVLYPMGFDALGLPAENAAIKAKAHPKPFTEKAIKNYIKQMKELGLSYDWSRVLSTSDSNYYKWDQWIFLKMFKKGLAYKKQSPVNWCKKCNTVLANEQVHDGKCWRHEDVRVEIKHLNQWYLKITNYADELSEGLKKLKQWPDRIKKLQKNWIGKSFGTEISFEVEGKKWPIFTTRPDTIYGVTFMVVSAQHPKLMEVVTDKEKKAVEKFVKKLSSVSEEEIDQLEKEGVFTGSYAINPVNNEKIPVYAGNFVLADYGSGMVMAVPGHDQRDYEFAKKYKIEINEVISGGDIKKCAYVGEGKLVNSGKFNGIESDKAKEEITKFLQKKKLGKKTINYRLRDWLVSRQRYWGTPIPIVNCESCGEVPVPEKDLPVKLPEKVKFGKGNPLESADKWINVKCPRCGGKVREMWYFRKLFLKNMELILQDYF
jgi:leucyl-tRNA synthetase